MDMSKNLGAEMVELHTGTFSNLFFFFFSSLPYSNHSVKELELPRYELSERLEKSIEDIKNSAVHANKIGLQVAAGHGLNYHNVHEMMKIEEIIELNIGQSIIARSLFSGLADAVKEMKKLTTR